MYHEYFGLIQSPFNVTPDSHFLYPSPMHEGAIETLKYGIHQRKGFLMLTGEVGTGKTTSIRALINRLDASVQTSVILNPLVSTMDLIKAINRDFGCDTPSQNLQDQLDALNYFVLESNKEGRNAVVIIDEAQDLSFEALEMTRLLSNLETETHKLLQIILVGQPELEEKLNQEKLRQLKQRIQVFCRLKPLDALETENYVNHRILTAGNNPLVAFEKNAIKELQKISCGIPRIINTVCDLALLAAYNCETRVITKNLIQCAAKEAPIYVYHS